MGDKFLELFIKKTFYNELFNKLKSYIYLHRDEIKVRSYTLSSISYKALDDFSVKSVLTRNMVGDMIESYLLVVAILEIKGHSKYGYEVDNAEIWLDVTVSYQLNNGLHHFCVGNITEYDATNKEMKQTPDFTLEFVPYIYARDMKQVAEGIVRRYYPEALQTPMPLPIDEYLSNIGLTKVEGKLIPDSSVFGEMIFKDTTVTLYDEDTPKELAVSKGTILVDPEVICLRTMGSRPQVS